MEVYFMKYTIKVALATALFFVFISFWFTNTNTFTSLLGLVSYCNIEEFLVMALGWVYVILDNNLVDIFLNCAIAYSVVEISVLLYDRITDTFKTA